MIRSDRLESNWTSLKKARSRRQARRARFVGRLENLEPRQLLAADPVISEFVALNTAVLQDENGAYSDWLEIQNRGDMTANISNYYLTDDAADLTKWQIPNGTSLAAGETLVVFASGKDRSGAELHTNFTIDELGGDLAFVAPDGTTIVSDFLGHPALGKDQAYGSFRPSGDEDFVPTGSAVRILVPSDNSLGTTWTGGAEPFDDAAWLAGVSGVGYDTRDASSVFTVSTYASTSQISTLAQADNAIAGNNLRAGFPVTAEHQVVNFLDSAGGGNFGNDVRFPGLPTGDNEDFAMRATTTFFLNSEQAGPWTFGFNSDDGGRVRIDGINVIVDDSTHGTTDFLGQITLAAGQHTLEYVFFERAGGAAAELFAAPGNKTAFDNSFSLVGDPDGVLPLTSLDALIETDIETEMFGQRASAYLRYAFDVENTADVQSMTLDLQLDDGAVVYLNGVQVYKDNAPASPAFNSTAVAEAGLNGAEVDLTSQVGLLQNGSNIIAVHGLNAGAGDEEFFVDVKLNARALQDPVVGFMAIPTPGRDNADVDPLITEFLAANKSDFVDEDGDSSDWIEIHNPGVTDVVITGWYLTDDPTLAQKWQIPKTVLEAGEYLVVFASGKDRAVAGSELHTDFQLDADGDYIALVRPDGVTVQSEYALGGEDFTQQFDNVAFGVRGAEMFEEGENDPVQGLVAYWDFEEGSGTTLTDISGNGGDGTINNMEAGDWIQGRSGGTTALNFDGVDEFIETGKTATDLDFAGGVPRTVAGWVRSSIFFQGTNGGVFELGEGDTDFAFRSVAPLGSLFSLEYQGSDIDGNLVGTARLSTSVTANEWFHFATTYDGEMVKLYVNGEVRGEAAAPDLTTDDSVPFTIGRWTSNFFKGAIDELAVWDMALDGNAVAELAAETLTPFEIRTVNRLIGVDRNRFSVRQVNASGSFAGQVTGQVGGGDNPLADVDALLALPAGDPGAADEFTFTYDNINFYDTGAGGDTGLFGTDEAFPLDDEVGDDNDFALHATATLVVPEGSEGEFVFAVNSDDGSRLRIDGIETIVDNARHAASTQTGTITLAAGEHTLDLVYFERDGGAALELLYASATDGFQEGEFELIEILPDQRTPEVAPPVTLAPRVFFPEPTPGAANNLGVEIFIGDTSLSVPHGFYDEPFQLEITNATANVDIWYTLDGTEPSPDNENALLYGGALTIASTTTLRAKAFMENAAPSRTATTTYLFIDDILTQSPDGQRPEGVPTNWNPGGTQSVWGMDPDIVNSPTWGPLMEEALTQIPTMSLVMDLEDIFGSDGIYTRAGNRGKAWERPSSLELIYPDGTGPDDGFTVNAGVRVRGGFSRSNDNPKHAFRFFFRQEYGDSKLDYALFGDEGVDQFDKIDLRTTQNYSWAFQNDTRNTFLRDIFSRDLQLAMGQPSTRGEYYHMYVNGMYWGLFQTEERPGASFAADNHGGDPEDWDVVHNEIGQRRLAAIDGTMDSTERLWNEFVKTGGLSDANMEDYYRVQGYNPDGTRNPEYERMLDVDNLIDYMLITYYTSDADGPGSKFTRPQLNNYYAIYNRENPDGWKFIEHDSEHSLDTGNGASANYNMVSPLVNNGAPLDLFNAHWMHEQLANTNSDYRQHFIDRVTEYMEPGGVLDPENLRQLLRTRADQFDLAIIAESARWGDAKRAAPFTKTNWDSAVQTTLDFVIDRNEHLLNQFRCAGSSQVVPNPNPATCSPAVTSWYPDFDAPAPTPSSGNVDAGTQVNLSVPGNATIEETTLVSSNIMKYRIPDAAFDASFGQTWVNPGFSEAGFTFLSTGDIGYEDGSGYEDLIRTEVPSGTTSVYIRPFIKFSVDDSDNDGSHADEFDDLILGMRYDDGFIAYLNGVEIARANAPANPTWNSTATTTHDDAAAVLLEEFVLGDEAKAALMATNNVLAVHGLNESSASSDFLIGYELIGRKKLGSDIFPGEIYYTTDGSDPRASGGTVNPAAIAYDPAGITIDQNTLLNARSTLNGQWSPLTQEFFQVAQPTIKITELNYNPHNPTAAELAVDADLDSDDFEFIEVQNDGSDTVSLAGLQFTDGVEFSFPSTSLEPGEYGVVVRDVVAFELRYGTSANVLGSFSSGGLNNGGEQVTLVDGLGFDLVSFEYNDADPWPSVADGVGGTLEFVGTAGASYSKYSSWRGSTDFGGSPGAAGSAPVGIVINEVLTNTTLPLVDSIELLNTTSSPMDIGGWYLSDAAGDLQKFQIPVGTMLAAGAYIVFDETHFNPTPETPGPNDFALDGNEGDDVYLVIPAAEGNISQIADDVHFGAAASGESFGRVPNGTGRLAPMSRTTLGGENGPARVGPLLISELNYNPGTPSPAAMAEDENITTDDLEFIEIHNPTSVPADMTDWRIRGGVDFDFDDATFIGARETVLIIPFNPDNSDNASRLAAFRAHYGIGEEVILFGGFTGQLSDDDERVQLQRPGDPPADDPTFIPYLSEDEILYDSGAPWPDTSGGDTLQRLGANFYGNAVASWAVSTPAPGSVNFVGGLTGDFNGDDVVDATDIDLLYDAINAGNGESQFDLDGNNSVDAADAEFLVENILGTFMGDANLDGIVDARDLNVVGVNWRGNAGWAGGDFTGDGQVSAQDLNLIGINWRSGAAAALAGDHQRVPRAPLADAVVPRAVVDAAIVELDDVRDAAIKTGLAPQAIGSEHDAWRVESRVAAKRWRGKPARFHQTVDQPSTASGRAEEVDLVDDVFAGL